MKTTTFVLLALTIMGLLCFACTKSNPNKNDSTPPKVEIKVKKNNQYEVVSSAELNTSLDLMCVVTDPEGVRSIKLEYFGYESKRCVVDGDDGFENGTAPVDLPKVQQVILQGDASGKVTDTLPVYSVLQPKCSVPGVGQGIPLDHVITASCKGENWSSDSQNNHASTELKITVKS